MNQYYVAYEVYDEKAKFPKPLCIVAGFKTWAEAEEACETLQLACDQDEDLLEIRYFSIWKLIDGTFTVDE